ncbi:proheparin-binding EGF-like growth factor [Tachyglossus aculeatus]|uniref:proheparin-binding EGF-like growth factor n=1 Tax=Tachyglossus aculeatus TaxID=9261 RepID=UPI0018F43B90|nr:proheparin-binding EGF-like growth factor [Tachyglossus aculeatus]
MPAHRERGAAGSLAIGDLAKGEVARGGWGRGQGRGRHSRYKREPSGGGSRFQPRTVPGPGRGESTVPAVPGTRRAGSRRTSRRLGTDGRASIGSVPLALLVPRIGAAPSPSCSLDYPPPVPGIMRLPSFAAHCLLAAVCWGLVAVEGEDLPASGALPTAPTDRTGQHGQPEDGSALPRVAFSSKPQALVTPGKAENGKRRKKNQGLGRKRDPCLRRYKDFCIHGECKYVKELKAPSCVCQQGYHGERCHGLILPVENRLYGYDHTTALAVVAVVLSSVCLLIIAGLLMFRYHRRGVYDVENEEKTKLGIPSAH